MVCILFVAILTVSGLPITGYAQTAESELNETEDCAYSEVDFDYDDTVPEEDVSACCMPISQPQENAEEADSGVLSESNLTANTGISTLAVGDPDESTDRTLQLDSLNATAVQNEGDNGNLKCLIPKDKLDTYAKTEFFSSAITKYPTYMQGGCSDGKYLYFAFIVYKEQYADENLIGTFIVTCHFDSNGKIQTDAFHSSKDNSKLAEIGHCNSMTYNALTDQIVTAGATKDKQTVYTINAAYLRSETSSLTLAKHYISCRANLIAYNATLNRYVVNVSGVFSAFCVLDSNFELIAAYIPKKDSALYDKPDNIGHAGLYCDDTYIYSVCHYGSGNTLSKGKVQNVISILNWNGEVVKEVNLSFNRVTRNGVLDSYEAENIIVHGNKVLMGFNCSHSSKGNAGRHYYYYDLSSQFFHIQYCPDENVETYQSSGNKTYSQVLYGQSTKIKENFFTKKGYKFAGWTLYIPGEDIWSYKNSAGTIKWYKEGTQPEGYAKTVYKDKQSVSQTVKSGKTVMFCANWAGTKTFHVAFNANGGSGSMPSQIVTYGTSKTMPENTFTKKGCTFKGWMIYNRDRDLWLYQNTDGSEMAWYKEGAAPVGYTKRIYKNQTTIAKTAPAGQHLVFYAQWNEYIILYNANGMSVSAGGIKTPTRAVYGSSNTVKKYTDDEVTQKKTLRGYRQHRLELDKWRYQNRTNADDTPWFNKSKVNTDKYKLYLFTGSTVKQTVQIGEHVVFQAQWS